MIVVKINQYKRSKEMKKRILKKVALVGAVVTVVMASLTGCLDESNADSNNQISVQDKLSDGQATPTDITFSLEK